MRWRAQLTLALFTLVPAVALAAGLGAGPQLADGPVTPLEVVAPAEVTPPPTLPIDLVLPEPASDPAPPAWVGVSATSAEASTASFESAGGLGQTLQFTVVDLFSTVLLKSATFRNTVVPEPGTALLVLVGLSALALRRR